MHHHKEQTCVMNLRAKSLHSSGKSITFPKTDVLYQALHIWLTINIFRFTDIKNDQKLSQPVNGLFVLI